MKLSSILALLAFGASPALAWFSCQDCPWNCGKGGQKPKFFRTDIKCCPCPNAKNKKAIFHFDYSVNNLNEQDKKQEVDNYHPRQPNEHI